MTSTNNIAAVNDRFKEVECKFNLHASSVINNYVIFCAACRKSGGL